MFLKSSKSPEAETSTPKNGQPLSIVDAGDAELLGKVLFKPVDRRELISFSTTWIQTRVETKLLHLRSLWNRFQYHCCTSFDRVYPFIVHASWPCWNGLGGFSLCKNTSSTQADVQVIGMVCCIWIHHVCWCCDGMANIYNHCSLKFFTYKFRPILPQRCPLPGVCTGYVNIEYQPANTNRHSGRISLRRRNGATHYASWLDIQTHWDLSVVSAQLIVSWSLTLIQPQAYRTADGFSLMFLSVIVIARDGNWTPSNGTIYVCSCQQ